MLYVAPCTADAVNGTVRDLKIGGLDTFGVQVSIRGEFEFDRRIVRRIDLASCNPQTDCRAHESTGVAAVVIELVVESDYQGLRRDGVRDGEVIVVEHVFFNGDVAQVDLTLKADAYSGAGHGVADDSGPGHRRRKRTTPNDDARTVRTDDLRVGHCDGAGSSAVLQIEFNRVRAGVVSAAGVIRFDVVERNVGAALEVERFVAIAVESRVGDREVFEHWTCFNREEAVARVVVEMAVGDREVARCSPNSHSVLIVVRVESVDDPAIGDSVVVDRNRKAAEVCDLNVGDLHSGSC